jgi:hypothetical protein
MSAVGDPFDFSTEGIGPNARAAALQQRAAVEAMRAKQAAASGPVAFLPFGKMQPFAKYAGMQVIPFRRNKFVDHPELILANPEPGWHYGWIQWSTHDKNMAPWVAEAKGKVRSGIYSLVYLDELREDNDAAIYVEDILTEAGTRKLVLWQGHAMIKISPQVWYEHYEMPALASVVRSAQQHIDAFHSFSMGAVDDGKGNLVGSGDFRDVKKAGVQVSMAMDVG